MATVLPLVPPAQVLQRGITSADLVDAFLAGRSQRTLEAYQSDLEDFRQFVQADNVDEAARLLLAHGQGEANRLALAYRADLMRRELQAATVNRRLAALRSLTKLARTLGMVPWSLSVPNLKVQAYRDTRGPGRQGFRRLLEETELRHDAKALRDRAALRLLHDLALRRAEVVSLDLADVDLESGKLSILGKAEPRKNCSRCRNRLRRRSRLGSRSAG